MTLVQLRHLLSVADTGSFSRSALLLNITQPALSRSIRSLEDDLGQPLFERVGRRSDLTPFGHDVLPRARQVVQDAQTLRDSGRATTDGRLGQVRVGMGSGPGALWMRALMKAITEQHPGLKLEIARGRTASLVQALRERRLDLLVVDARSLQIASDLHVQTICEARGAFLCRKGHPLLKKRGPITFTALSAFPIASSPLSDETARTLVERYGPKADPEVCVSLRCDELSSLVALAADTDVVLLAARETAPHLVELSLKPPLEATARYGFVHLEGRVETPAMRIVRQTLLELHA